MVGINTGHTLEEADHFLLTIISLQRRKNPADRREDPSLHHGIDQDLHVTKRRKVGGLDLPLKKNYTIPINEEENLRRVIRIPVKDEAKVLLDMNGREGDRGLLDTWRAVEVGARQVNTNDTRQGGTVVHRAGTIVTDLLRISGADLLIRQSSHLAEVVIGVPDPRHTTGRGITNIEGVEVVRPGNIGVGHLVQSGKPNSHFMRVYQVVSTGSQAQSVQDFLPFPVITPRHFSLGCQGRPLSSHLEYRWWRLILRHTDRDCLYIIASRCRRLPLLDRRVMVLFQPPAEVSR